jgi:hypothetical protein
VCVAAQVELLQKQVERVTEDLDANEVQYQAELEQQELHYFRVRAPAPPPADVRLRGLTLCGAGVPGVPRAL